MAKSKKLVTSLAALAVTAAAVSPAITADAAKVNPVVLKAQSFRGGEIVLPSTYGSSRIVWDRSTINWNQINKFQTVYGVVGSQKRPIQMQVNLLNYPIFAEKAEPQVIKIGEKPVLPERLNIKFVDKFYPNAIKWEEAPVADKEGTFFVKGSYTKDGRTVVTSALYTVEGVEDKEAPVIKYDGAGVYDVVNGAKFELPKLTATDNVDEEIEVKHVIKDASGKELDAIDTKVAGKYTITYMAEDKAGNKAKSVELQVTVAEAIPAVESVSAINLKQVEVKFNKAVDADTVTTSTVKVMDGTTTLSNISISVAEDKKSAIVYYTGANKFDQNKEYKVVVDGVKASDKTTALAKFEGTVKTVDVTFPTAVDAKATSSKTIELTFSEPVDVTAAAKVWDEFYIDGVRTYADVTTGSLLTANKITLNLASSLTAGEHKVVVKSGLKDFAGFPVAEKEFTVNVATDTTAPTISSVKSLAKDKLEVVFSEPIVSSNIANDTAVFKVTPVGGSAIAVATGGVANPSGDRKTFELTLAGNLTASALVEATVAYKNIADIEGNKTATEQTVKFTAQDDTTAPTATATVAANNVVKVEFSEAVSAVNTANAFELYKDGVKQSNTITASATTGDITGKKYDLAISGADSLSGNYVVKLKKDIVVDGSIRGNYVAETSFNVTFGDVKAPEVATVGLTAQLKDKNTDAKLDTLRLVVPFSEAMEAASATNLSNYIFNFGGNDVTGSSLTATAALAADGKSVVFEITGTAKTGSESTDLTIAGTDVTNTAIGNGAVKVKVLGVKDATGNTLKATDINSAKTFGAYIQSGAALTSVKATGKRTVQITSATPIESINPNGIRFVTANGTDVAQTLMVSGVAFSADKKTATLTLSSDLKAAGTYNVDEANSATAAVALDLVVVTNDAIVNNLGQYVANGALTNSNTYNGAGTDYAVADFVAPSISTVSRATATDTINVTFDEAITQLSNTTLAAVAGDFIVTLEDGTVLNPAAGEYEITDATADASLQIVIKKNGVVGKGVSVALTSGRYITDASVNTNVANAFTTKTSMTGSTADTVTELVAPTVAIPATTGANNVGTKLVVTFGEALYNNDVAIADGADVKSLFTYDGIAGNYTSATYNATDKTVTFVMTAGEEGKKLTTSANVTDKAGNAPASTVFTYASTGTVWSKN